MNKNCDICGANMSSIFTQKVLEKYNVTYFYCKECHFIQTMNPYWLDEAYTNSINDSDTGYLGRNILMSRITLILIYFLFPLNSKYLDYAGGYGIFTRLMNDYGITFLWSDSYTKNLFAQGLEYTNQKIEMVTCFEAFEHFTNPVEECKKILSLSNSILLSTTLIPADEIPDPHTWGYYGFHHGQHIAFYSKKALERLAKKYNLHLYTNNSNIHLITHKKINSFFFRCLILSTKLQIDILIKKLL